MRRRDLACGLLALSLAWAGWADPVERAFDVTPSNCDLTIDGKLCSKVAGKSNTFQVDLGNTSNAATPKLVFSAPGYQALTVEDIPVSRLMSKDWSSPALQLKKSSTFSQHPVLWFVGLLGLAGGGFALFQKSQQSKALEQRNQKVTVLSAGSDIEDKMILKVFGQYQLVQRLGAGGMASVYKGVPKDSLDEKEAVAIKVVKADVRSEDYDARLKREINVSRRLNHVNVLRIIDWGEQEGQMFLVMELVDGKPLTDFIPQKGLGVAESMRYLPGIVEALAYAHNLGIVHRDLKPDNVMVTKAGKVKLMDFGLARDQQVKTLTVAGTAMGTPAYMAPEQVLTGPSKANLNVKSDQYALGVLIYELICGRRPFEDEDPMKVIMQHLSSPPPPVSQFCAGVPAPVEAVLAKMLEKDPAKRFQSVKEAGEALMTAAQSLSPLAATSLINLQALELSALATVAEDRQTKPMAQETRLIGGSVTAPMDVSEHQE